MVARWYWFSIAHSDIFGVYVLIFEMNTEYIAIFSFFIKKKKKKKKKAGYTDNLRCDFVVNE
jgi:hypothetical protein